MTDELLKEIIVKLTENNALLRQLIGQASIVTVESGLSMSEKEIIDTAYEQVLLFLKNNRLNHNIIKKQKDSIYIEMSMHREAPKMHRMLDVHDGTIRILPDSIYEKEFKSFEEAMDRAIILVAGV